MDHSGNFGYVKLDFSLSTLCEIEKQKKQKKNVRKARSAKK